MSKVLNIESLRNTILHQELLTRNDINTKVFVANIFDLCEEASDRAKQIPAFFSEYTLHDRTHFLRVTELMGYVLGSTLKNLNTIEIGLLILAAFYHDQGMLITNTEFHELELNEDYLVFRDNWFINHGNYFEIQQQLNYAFISMKEKERLRKILSELDAAMLTDFLREGHGQRSHDFIINSLSDDKRLFVNGVNISTYLAKICLSHVKSIDWISNSNGLNYDENIGTYRVNTIFLSIILRLADILDFDSDRTPDVLFKSIHFTSPISILEWQKHRSVKGWEISKELIRFTMHFEHPVYEKAAHIFLDWIDRELSHAHSLLRQSPSRFIEYQLEISEKIDRTRIGPKGNSYLYHDLEFTLSRDEIVKLLMTDNLYKNTSLFIRELLQNSLDALRLRQAILRKDGLVWNSGVVSFHHYVDISGQQVVECVDNGCGMDEEIISKFLGKVGRSFYRSPEFERQRILLKEKGIDFEPCSQFGIGFMSCFMVGDRIQIFTRKDYGSERGFGQPLIIEINGLSSLIVIKKGNPNQEPGTTVKVYCREKPLFFDDWSDTIRLILTLKGYAMATEFPIKAICSIEEIKEEIHIPATIDIKKTFLEECGINNLLTYEIDLTTVNKNLKGVMRQSFIADANGLPSLENAEAKWELKINDRWAHTNDKYEMSLHNKLLNQSFNHHYHRLSDKTSICLDGILVCGSPGRSDYQDDHIERLGHITARIYTEHAVTMDIRGDIKPEISPAREPLEKGSAFDPPIGWRQLQDFINIGRGWLWEQVLSLSDKGLSPEMFWKLIVIYQGSPLHIPNNSLIKHLQLPIENGYWLGLSSIKSFYTDNDFIYVKDLDEKVHCIQFSDEIQALGKINVNQINFKYWLSNILTSISKLTIEGDQSTLFLRNFFDSDKPSDNIISQTISPITFIPFDNLSKDYISTVQHINIANSEHPLYKHILKGKSLKQKDELQNFAESLLFSICHLIREFAEQKKPFTIKVKARYLKYTSIYYQNIHWDKYSNELRPPYKIFVDAKNTAVITEEDIIAWSKQLY